MGILALARDFVGMCGPASGRATWCRSVYRFVGYSGMFGDSLGGVMTFGGVRGFLGICTGAWRRVVFPGDLWG